MLCMGYAFFQDSSNYFRRVTLTLSWRKARHFTNNTKITIMCYRRQFLRSQTMLMDNIFLFVHWKPPIIPVLSIFYWLSKEISTASILGYNAPVDLSWKTMCTVMWKFITSTENLCLTLWQISVRSAPLKPWVTFAI